MAPTVANCEHAPPSSPKSWLNADKSAFRPAVSIFFPRACSSAFTNSAFSASFLSSSQETTSDLGPSAVFTFPLWPTAFGNLTTTVQLSTGSASKWVKSSNKPSEAVWIITNRGSAKSEGAATVKSSPGEYSDSATSVTSRSGCCALSFALMEDIAREAR